MTAAYLTEAEIIRELRLPVKVGRIKMEMWKACPTFPKPEPGTGGRRWFPAVRQWIDRFHHVEVTHAADISAVPEGGENFNAWRERVAAREARKARKPPNAGPDLSSAARPLDSAVVTSFRPDQKRLPRKDNAAVAGWDGSLPG